MQSCFGLKWPALKLGLHNDLWLGLLPRRARTIWAQSGKSLMKAREAFAKARHQLELALTSFLHGLAKARAHSKGSKPQKSWFVVPPNQKTKTENFRGNFFCFGDRAAAENGFRKKPARDFETNRYFRFFHLQPSSCQASVHFKLGPISCQRHRTRDKSLDKIVLGLSRLEPFIFLTYELLRRFRIKISVYSKI